MRLGHFGALCCFVIALLSGGLLYWDLQDGYFSSRLVSLPIITGTMAVALAVFPGGNLTFREAATDRRPDGLAQWLGAVPVLHRRAWLLATGLSIYLSLAASEYLQGNDFFTLGQQLTCLVSMAVLWLFLRKQLRRMW